MNGSHSSAAPCPSPPAKADADAGDAARQIDAEFGV